MVAASAPSEGLRKITAVGLLTAIAVSLFISALLRDWSVWNSENVVGLSPDVLAYRARGLLHQFGYTDSPADVAFGFAYEPQLIQHANRLGADPRQVLGGRPPGLIFWYRESPDPLMPAFRRRGVRAHGGSRPDDFMSSITREDPPLSARGMTLVTLDPQGRLVGFEGIPRAHRAHSGRAAETWKATFDVAGIDAHRFQQVSPEWTPLVPFDERTAWVGSFEERPDVPVRIELATVGGTLTSMVVTGEWTREPFSQNAPLGLEIAMMGLISTGYVLAWRNLRHGRSDTRGAARLALAGFILKMAGFFLLGHHVGGTDEFRLFWRAVMEALFVSCNFGAFYLAIEPAVRRRRPRILTGWVRALHGGIDDPLVAKQALIGLMLGLAGSALAAAVGLFSPALSMQVSLDAALNLYHATGMLIGQFGNGIATGLGMCCLVVLLGTLMRSDAFAAAVGILLFGVLYAAELGTISILGLLGGGCLATMLVLATLQAGLVAGVLCAAAFGIVLTIPLTLDRSVWFSGVSQFSMLLILGFGAYWAYTASRAPHATL